MMLYKECKIPTDWLLDCGMVNKVQAQSLSFKERIENCLPI